MRSPTLATEALPHTPSSHAFLTRLPHTRKVLPRALRWWSRHVPVLLAVQPGIASIDAVVAAAIANPLSTEQRREAAIMPEAQLAKRRAQRAAQRVARRAGVFGPVRGVLATVRWAIHYTLRHTVGRLINLTGEGERPLHVATVLRAQGSALETDVIS